MERSIYKQIYYKVRYIPNQYANWDQVASTGFRAIRNNENGFISAEHVLLNGAPVYNSSGNSIGTTTFLSKDLPTSNPYRAKSEVGFLRQTALHPNKYCCRWRNNRSYIAYARCGLQFLLSMGQRPA